jgi:hypothetical protein
VNGRDANGFVPGSEAAKDYERALVLGPDGGPDLGDTSRNEVRRQVRAEKRRQRQEAALNIPDWWYDPPWSDPTKVRNSRFLAREIARRAAEALGVPLPDWVVERAKFSAADRERIRAASLARYEKP